MIIRKTRKDIEQMHRSGELLAEVHELLAPLVQVGATTREIDAVAEAHIRKHGGQPSFKGYNGFPATLCTSVNSKVVHGIPDDIPLEEGDLLSIDCGVTLRGWVSDSARSYVVGGTGNDEAQRLIDISYDSLEAGIAQCHPGNTVGDIGHAVQSVAEASGLHVIRKLVGHGVGRNMHEDPQVPNYGTPGTGPVLEEGYVFAIEPMFALGTADIVEDPVDGWSIYTADGSLAAHVEHTVAVTADGPLVLTRPA
ncbi:MAG: methionine aminopeptidase type [Thermoleophilia bacterium]|jgi:methionyl aminopeptidase|nr:methionine aminopeptidase type [Thermoleophilia bacterium]